jgi:hypothetical protein
VKTGTIFAGIDKVLLLVHHAGLDVQPGSPAGTRATQVLLLPPAVTADSLAAGVTHIMSFVVQGPDNVSAFFLLTTAGGEYLQISGEGDLALIEEAARSLRHVAAQP